MASEKPKKPAGKRTSDDKPARKGSAKPRFSDDKPARGGASRGASAGRGGESTGRSSRPTGRGGAPGSRGNSRNFGPGSSTGRGYKRPGDDFNEFSEDSYRALEEGTGSTDRGSRDGDRSGSRKPYQGSREGFGAGRKPAGGRGGERSFDTRKPTGYKSSGPKRDDSDRKPSFGGNRDERGPRKPFGGDREERGPRKPFGADREERGPRKPFGADREERGPRKSFGGDREERGPRKPFGDREERGPRKPFGADRDDRGPRKSFGGDREERGPRKTFGGDREERGPRKTFGGDRDERGPRKSFGDAEERGPRKSYGGDRDERPAPRKSQPENDSDRPVRPYQKREQDGERQSEGRNKPDFKKSDFKKPDFKKKTIGAADSDRKPARTKGGKFGKTEDAPEYNLERFEKRSRGKKENETDEQIRLNRFISNAGVCSRREADALIAAGEIKVNGQVVTEMGYLVNPSDTVQYGKKILNREKLVYVLLNKPKDFITTTEDPEDRKTVMELVANASKERIFPVGRLDRNTTGLLLFTNDGELAQKLSHPSHSTSKVYQIELDKPLTEDHEEQIKAGLELEDGLAEIDDIAILAPDRQAIGLELHIGRNRIVRRIFEHLGYEVVKLDRVSYAGLTKKDLPRGQWRYLTEKEVIRMKYFD